MELLQSRHPLEQSYGHSIYCWAREGCGKSHLLRAYCTHWQAEGVQSCYFNGENLPGREQLACYAPLTVVVFDNLQVLIGHRDREADLLYLLQKCYDEDVPLLVSADRPPQALNCMLEDVATRLASFFVFHIQLLDEDLMMEFVTKEAQRLGLTLNEQLRARIHNLYMPGEMKLLSQLLRRLASVTAANISVEELEQERQLLRH